MDWAEFGKGVGAALGGVLGVTGSARLWRQIDKVKQARSDGEAAAIRVEARAKKRGDDFKSIALKNWSVACPGSKA